MCVCESDAELGFGLCSWCGFSLDDNISSLTE